MAAFFPEDFTTVAHGPKLRRLHRALGLAPGASPVQRHRDVLDRLTQALGPPGDTLPGIVERMTLPWLLYAQALRDSEEEATEQPGEVAGHSTLLPLPAARRRRGLTSIRGYLSTVLGLLDFISDGVTRDELVDHIRSNHEGLKDSSIGVMINSLLSELSVVRREGDTYRLSDRGAALLESGDSDELADWMLTHILGFDYVLARLRDDGPTPSAQLLKELQTINPGWTTTYAPSALLSWIKAFDLVTNLPDAHIALTARGEGWAQRIEWTPESLQASPDVQEANLPEILTTAASAGELKLPPFAEIRDRVLADGMFKETQLATLHAGLWAHPRRHFAILSGLSGTGKTLLARSYGRAILPDEKEVDRHLLTVPVQPGWYDPSAVLGYVNPLRSTSYIRTGFLEFLLAAAVDSERPYTVVFDEMNLSRPEQYLAPLLSAMETGATIVLHKEGTEFDGVPAEIAYPANLVIIGTLNMDETTHAISDKILDRAITLDFWDVDLSHYPRWGKSGLTEEQEAQARRLMDALMSTLKPVRLHFGWRTVDDILGFTQKVVVEMKTHEIREALDQIVYSKILPKLRGEDSKRMREALSSTIEVLDKASLVTSAAKLRELERDLHISGTARFWR